MNGIELEVFLIRHDFKEQPKLVLLCTRQVDLDPYPYSRSTVKVCAVRSLGSKESRSLMYKPFLMYIG